MKGRRFSSDFFFKNLHSLKLKLGRKKKSKGKGSKQLGLGPVGIPQGIHGAKILRKERETK